MNLNNSSTDPAVSGISGDKRFRCARIAISVSTVVFLMALLFSALSLGGGLFALKWWVPPPSREAAMQRYLDRHVRLAQLEQEEELEAEPEPEPEEEREEEEEPEPVFEPEPEPEPEVIEEPEPEPEPEVIEEPPEVELPPPSDPGADVLNVEGAGSGGTGGLAVASGSGTDARSASPPQQPTRQERRQERREVQQAQQRRGPVRMEDTSVPPRPISTSPSISYPQELRDQGIQGRVSVRCMITPDGRVRACQPVAGPPQLVQLVIQIVSQWRFSPGLDHNQQPVVTAYTFNIPFRLR